MNAPEHDYLLLAHRAVQRWAKFPVQDQPRPLVLTQPVIEAERGFTSSEAKDAWFNGRYEWLVEVPEGVRERAQRSGGPDGRENLGHALRITDVGRGQHEFATDRGTVTLPAHWLRGPSILGSLWVLDPAVVIWAPDDRDGQSRRFDQGLPPLVNAAFRPIAVDPDGLSITVPWSDYPSARFTRVEIVETATAVCGVAISATDRTRPSMPRLSLGVLHRVPARLREPLGQRVFVDLLGQAMQVEARSTAS